MFFFPRTLTSRCIGSFLYFCKTYITYKLLNPRTRGYASNGIRGNFELFQNIMQISEYLGERVQ